MAEPGIFKELAGFIGTILRHQNTTRQNTDRSFQHAHISIEHHMRNLGAAQKRLDDRDQHIIVGADNLTHKL